MFTGTMGTNILYINTLYYTQLVRKLMREQGRPTWTRRVKITGPIWQAEPCRAMTRQMWLRLARAPILALAPDVHDVGRRFEVGMARSATLVDRWVGRTIDIDNRNSSRGTQRNKAQNGHPRPPKIAR